MYTIRSQGTSMWNMQVVGRPVLNYRITVSGSLDQLIFLCILFVCCITVPKICGELSLKYHFTLC